MCKIVQITICFGFLGIGLVNGDSTVTNRLDRSQNEHNACNNSFRFLCGSGECIPRDQECDGRVNCKDASDETVECLRLQCHPYVFRCSYGACVDPDLECDGKADCKDGSDENSTNCKNPKNVCAYGQFGCTSGECIKDELKCDGTPDCQDNSDEISRTCWKFKCPGYTYRCGYGACVDGTAVCNGTVECFDGSDEECKTPSKRGTCVLPEHPVFGNWSIFGGGVYYSPGVVVDSGTILTVQCNQHNSSDGTVTIVCRDGRWSNPIGKCTRQVSVVINLFVNINVKPDEQKADPDRILFPR